MRDDVLDVRLFEEPQTAPDLERDVPAPQLELDFDRVPMAAVEDGDVVELPLLVKQVENVLGDELRLDAPVVAGRHGRLQPGRPHGAQFLGQPARVHGDAGVRKGQDLRHGPIVRLELVLPSVRISLLEPQDVLEIRAPETVDGLRVIADDADVPVRRSQRVYDRALDRVGVLVLIHQDVLELVGQNAPHVRMLRQENEPRREEVVVVEELALAFAHRVKFEDARDVLGLIGEHRITPGEDFL